MKVGLVLEGGAMRGMYTAGVLDVLMENAISPDGIIGVSAGALFGVNLLSGQEGRVIRYSKRFNHDKNYMGILPLLKERNIVSTRYAYDEVPRKLDVFDDGTFQRAAKTTPFYAVLSQVENGHPYYVRIRSVFDQMDVLRASASMPFVSKPVRIGNLHYLDGGVTDSIPFRWMAGNGYDRLIVVLTRDQSYRKKPMSPALIHAFYKKSPELEKRLKNRHEAYNESADTLREWEEDRRAFVIRPSRPLSISRTETDPSRLQAVYEIGLADAEAQMDALRAYTNTTRTRNI